MNKKKKSLIFLPWYGLPRAIGPEVNVMVRIRNGTLWANKAKMIHWEYCLENPNLDVVQYAIIPNGYGFDEETKSSFNFKIKD